MKMTLFDSSYQVMHLTGGQLLINSPPDYGFALPFFVIGLGSAVFSCIVHTEGKHFGHCSAY
jgi:hypothetical protein